MPIERVEVVVGGLVAERGRVGGELSAPRAAPSVPVSATRRWIALRVRGSYHGRPDDIAAHTSAVQVLVDGSELFREPDAADVLDQIQGAIAYVDTIAPRPEARRFRGAARRRSRPRTTGCTSGCTRPASTTAHPLHDPAQPHEH